MSDSNLTEQQRFLFDYVDRNARAIALLGDNIFYFGELGMQEFESAKLMTGLLGEGRLPGRARHRGLSDRVLRHLRLRPSGGRDPYRIRFRAGQFAGRRRHRAEVHRRRRARPLRGPQRQRRRAGLHRARGKERDGSVRACTARSRCSAGRPRSSSSVGPISCATAGSTMSTSRSTIISARNSASPMASCNRRWSRPPSPSTARLRIPGRRALEGTRRARRRRAHGYGHGAVS